MQILGRFSFKIAQNFVDLPIVSLETWKMCKNADGSHQ